jgi:hypothetical protein
VEWMILGFQYLDNPRLRPVGKPEISRLSSVGEIHLKPLILANKKRKVV